MEDSLEKIEREMLEAKVALVQSPLGPVALADWADRLRALRERDDTFRAIVDEVIAAIIDDREHGFDLPTEKQELEHAWALLDRTADRLREAREGK